MNRLGDRIAALIRAAGPISVADYMAICLFDPEDGYYTTREPFGAMGDFITAPEVSQMFGELVAVWLAEAWRASGKPIPVTVAEIGPGRGTLMKDLVRTLGRIAPELAAKAHFALVEASPRLADIQRETLRDSGPVFSWHLTVDTLPDSPLFVIGNEIFDALPFRQFVRQGDGWLERAVGLDSSGALMFGIGTAQLAGDALPPETKDAPEGSIFEIAPAREALMSAIAGRIAAHGGAGIFFDYGHLKPGLGDTFQGIRKHRSEGVFDSPGEADLTSHVDFSALAAAARSHGLDAHLSTQARFLLGMGLLERAGRLGQTADEAARKKISADVERLAGPGQMGDLFKVLAILPAGAVSPPFRNAS
ncbi:class I SAM-dependent methyltransferase [Mesorhizobium sp. KR9-304]|uniref:class I SAM-dependent methyltransferase n=1 Tax=Mesorhizobium sp. KR9-304 TaxID=3156614 RepID=UPI0032B3B5D6